MEGGVEVAAVPQFLLGSLPIAISNVAPFMMSLSLTFIMRSLKLNVLVTTLFATFGYNGIIRAKGVMPYSLFGDFLLL